MYFKVKEYVDDIFEKHNPNEGELVGIEYNKIDNYTLLYFDNWQPPDKRIFLQL